MINLMFSGLFAQFRHFSDHVKTKYKDEQLEYNFAKYFRL